ncbi:hypothetical protein BGZ61DRAFT_501288 [Ilyonectria robusta]|uniref:uncharacterized protein n=1 Tax=Ilyonectria robusta TaxID=1079257 RepID=UPI001E8E04C6|nr:uncharacterized protein BGZ61DRAFT_501288 [Ilyonectria robusta]KAH8647014.1 hypothetical protein BGZ61DRAFT_501288 [Ilyonectria robusta]
MSSKTNFRVIIAGGGVAGLTLANALEILDQLGLLDELMEKMESVLWMADRDNRGHLICPRSDVSKLGQARTGYNALWGDSQILLQALFDNVQDESKILTRKNIVEIDHQPHGITVRCDDESSFEGNILVGADGVASRAREELWKLAEPRQLELVRQDKNSMIASSVQHLEAGDFDIGYDTDQSSLVVTTKNGRAYYFIFEKLNVQYPLRNIPHYTRAETEQFAIQHGDMLIRPDLKFSYLWEKTTSCQLVALEEAKFKLWTCGRIVCLGDSTYKMTPNVAAEGNVAIESVAALANSIKAMVDRHGGEPPTEREIEEYLRGYQKCREERAASVIDASAKHIRLQALRGPLERVFFRLFFPMLGDFLQDMASDMVIGATMLEYLPPPKASLSGTMPFNPTQGDGKKESKVKRALAILPMLGLFYLASRVLNAEKAFPWHDTVSRGQVASCLTNLGIIITIWSIESVRRANTLTLAQLLFLFTLLGQFFGVGLLSPLYYFIHYISSPIKNFKATNMRLTRMNYIRAIQPVMILAYYIPTYAMLFWPSLPRDLPLIRYTIGTLIVPSVCFWLRAWFTAPFGTAAGFLPHTLPPNTSDLTAFAREFLKFDAAFVFSATLMWLGYLFWDMKHAGMVQSSWLKIAIYAISTAVVLGPGGAAGLGWLWREDIITNKRHKAAVVQGTATKLR